VGDEPLVLCFAPQRKGDGAPAEHMILPFSNEDVLELDVSEKCLRFDDEIADRLTAVVTTFDDSIPGSLIVLLGLGNGEGDLAFYLPRISIRIGAAYHRTSNKEQARQHEQNQRSRASGSCVHTTDSTHHRHGTRVLVSRNSMPFRRMRYLWFRKSTVVSTRIQEIFQPLGTCHNRQRGTSHLGENKVALTVYRETVGASAMGMV
jgi:hypothetical protein